MGLGAFACHLPVDVYMADMLSNKYVIEEVSLSVSVFESSHTKAHEKAIVSASKES